MTTQPGASCDPSQLIAVFSDLEKRFADKFTKNTLRAGANLLARRIRKVTPVGPTGNLKRAIGQTMMKRARAGEINFIVGALKKRAKKLDGKGFHFHLVTGGTKSRTRKRIGGRFKLYDRSGARGTGAARANPFVVTTALSSKGEVYVAMERQALKELDKL